MLDVTLLPAFLLAVMVLLLSPGPNMALLVGTGACYGFRAAVFTALGILAATHTQSLQSVWGVGTLTSHVPGAFTLLRLAGSVYFFWMAARLLSTPCQRADGDLPLPKHRNVFAHGFLVESLNPYALLFFFGFLPQFVNPALGSATLQLLLLALLYCICSFGFDLLVARSSSLVARFASTRARFLQRYLLGGGYGCVGLWLLVCTLVSVSS